MSVTKSIVGLAVACLLTDQLVDSLEVPVHHFYPEWNQGMKKDITLKHLVHMTSGLQNHPNATVEIYPSPDFVKLGLAAELTFIPGEKWQYNNKSLNILAGIFKKLTGKRMDIYIKDRLFEPLGITNFSWSLDPSGNTHVMSGCKILPRDLAKIGLLLLNKGKVKNHEVISEEYVDMVVEPCDRFKGYGLLWWIDHARSISIIDDKIIAELRQAGLSEDFILKMEKMKGSYESDTKFIQRAESVFGKNPGKYITDNLGSSGVKLRRRVFKGDITYRADGYLGNYIIVDPKTKIVAVRMISDESFISKDDSFPNFKTMILNLTKP